MEDIKKAVEYLQRFGKALEGGVKRWVEMLPIVTQQHLREVAKKRLNTTFDTYNDAISAKVVDNVLLVELDSDNWIANAVESGVGQFNMKEGLLKSKKAKRSKLGYRYIHIPIGKKDEKDESKWGGTDKQREYQKRIQDVLRKPAFGMMKQKMMPDGRVMQYQKVENDDTLLQGFYRTRAFESAEQFHAGKSKPQWGFVLFRTVSENPEAKGEWNHPGIKPIHAFRATEQWLETAAEHLLDKLLESELDALNQRFKEY